MANTISDKLTYLEGTKSAIKDAIVAKGVACIRLPIPLEAMQIR